MTKRDFLGAAMALLAISLVVGCGGNDRDRGRTVERVGQPPVTYVDDDDPKMLAAIDKARSTVDQFIAALNHRKGSQSAFSVKLLIKDGDDGEHMWILPVRYESGEFIGRINNEPVKVTTVKMGDEVHVAKDQISDWMYVENGKLKGGYTLRVLRDSVPAKERAEFDKSIPFTIE